MVTRACISINNRCNMRCLYCHFHEKGKAMQAAEMDVFKILDNIISHIEKYQVKTFKLGFVGNGEPLLDYALLREYILYIDDYIKEGRIAAYTITNGTIADKEMLSFFVDHKVNVGFSIDGLKEIHDKLRCGSYDKVIAGIERYRAVSGEYPSMNCTVGRDVLEHEKQTIEFFKKFGNRITFSRMIGKYGISLDEFHAFLSEAQKSLNVRAGGYDCTMYGGKCGAGIDNLFYANGRIFICGNCIDLMSFPAETPLDKVHFDIKDFNRSNCYKETRTI